MAESPSTRQVTAGEVMNLLQILPPIDDTVPGPDDDVSPPRWAYREKTALLGAFDATALEPPERGERVPDQALREFLTRDCERVRTRQGRRWRLALSVRTTTLERLRTPEKLAEALHASPAAGEDATRDWAQRLLSNSLPPLPDLGLEELYAIHTLVGWFRDAPQAEAALALASITLPSPEEVRRHIARAQLLEPLRTLAGTTFCGRDRELEVLTRYVWPNQVQGRWLMVHGPGGVGKSTLVARFMLDHVTRPRPSACLPFAYLSFDRSDLIPEQPLTLLNECVRQLRLLLPELPDRSAQQLEKAVGNTLRADSRAQTEQGSNRGSRAGRVRDETALVSLFSHLVGEALSGTDRRVLLALDTFEQVQRKGPLAVSRLLDFLDLLQDACPWLRVVAAGRAPVQDPRFDELALQGFDEATALSFLRRQLPGKGPEYEVTLHAVARSVGSNPLTLKLAADLFQREGLQALHDATLRRQVQLRLQPEEVQGMLYRRILDHLEDPDLSRIASPGLAVRKVTPDVIRHVLARPCGLEHVDEQRARILFHMLKDEAALVEDVPGQEAVVHRADVRRIMLPLLRRDSGRTVDRIHRAAVKYYRHMPETDPVRAAEYRAEELYHRLCLGQTKTLDQRWVPEAGLLLDSALEELPPRGRVYLSERLGITVSSDLLRQADDETWGRQVLRASTVLLDDGAADKVLTLLEERPSHVDEDLALAALRIQALAALDRSTEALVLIEPALELASRASDAARFVELALLGARLDEDLGHFAGAQTLLTQARRAVEVADLGPVPPLSVAVAQLRLHRRSETLETPQAQHVRAEVLERLAGFGARDRARHPTLVRELAAEVGDQVPSLVSQTARVLGVDLHGFAGQVLRTSLSDDDVQDFAAVTQLVRQGTPTTAHGDADADVGAEPEEDTSAWLAGNTSVVRGDTVGAYIDSGADRQAAWNHALVNTYQYEVDQAPLTRKGSGRPRNSSRLYQATTCDAVVIVPGFMGSVLVDTDTGKRVWGDTSPWLIEAWQGKALEALQVTHDEREGDSRRIRPVELLQQPVWTPFFGGFEPFHRMRQLVHSCVVHPAAVLEFPYDWRLPAAWNARLLADAAARHLADWRAHHTLARERAARHEEPQPRLVFVAHSTGGLVACEALLRDPRLAELTRSVLCLGTPLHGTPKAVEILAGAQGPSARPTRLMRETLRRLPGFYDLLPDYRCVEDNGDLRRLTHEDVAQLGGDRDLAAEAMRTPRRVSLASFLPRIRTVVGTGQPTVQSVALDNGTVRPLRSIVRLSSDGSPLRDVHGTPLRWDTGGDGLVPRESASAGPSRPDILLPVRHGAFVTDETVLSCIQEILLDNPVSLLEPSLPMISGREEPGFEALGSDAVRSPQDDGGIGLPAVQQVGLSLSLPDLVVAGRPWEACVHGANGQDRVQCTVVVESPDVASTPVRLTARGGDFVGQVVVPSPGLYRITAVAAGAEPVSDVFLAFEPLDAT
ncbi:AAA family ATPase [Streptomyces sp. NPDC005122]